MIRQWVEVIHVRSFNPAALEKAIGKTRELGMAWAPAELDSIRFWIRSDLTHDICILLHWTEDAEQNMFSATGLLLVDIFSEFGWVEHSVWMDAGLVTAP